MTMMAMMMMMNSCRWLLQDFSKCDLLIILGTSLVVQPFASLTDRFAVQLFIIWLIVVDYM